MTIPLLGVPRCAIRHSRPANKPHPMGRSKTVIGGQVQRSGCILYRSEDFRGCKTDGIWESLHPPPLRPWDSELITLRAAGSTPQPARHLAAARVTRGDRRASSVFVRLGAAPVKCCKMPPFPD